MGFLEESLFHPIIKPSVITVEHGGVPEVLNWLCLKSLTTDSRPENAHGEILQFCLTDLTEIQACWLPIFAMEAVELDQDEHRRKKCKILHFT